MAAAIWGAGAIEEAYAEIKDYEIRRFLYLKTACGIALIQRTESTAGTLRYKGECPNQTAFPDGAIVECSDPEDDRSCRLMTNSTEFLQLELMQPKSPGAAEAGKEVR